MKSQLPPIAETILLDLIKGEWRTDKDRMKIADLMLKSGNVFNCIDECFKNHICKNPSSNDLVFSRYDEPHGMVFSESYKLKKRLSESHRGQWYIFIEILINSAVRFSKKNVEEYKDRKKCLVDKIDQIKKTAKKLAKLMRDANELESRWDYFGSSNQDVLDLIIQTASSMKQSEKHNEIDRGAAFDVMTRPEIEKMHLWADSRRMPSTVNLIEQIAKDADSKNIQFSHDTIYMEDINQKYNIALNFFFDELKRQVKMEHLNPEIINCDRELWTDIFTIVLNSNLSRSNFDDHLPISI